MILLNLIPLFVLGGLIAAVVAGVRAMATSDGDAGESTPIDTAEAAKSFAVHVALFLALLACAVGLIDLLQWFVEGDRIAGTNSDLARGLSFLIVGVPVYLLLLRTVDRRYTRRAEQGDGRPHRGWTAYLIAALTTTLIASLVSLGQVTDRLTSEFDAYRPEEMMQLLAWAALWAAHWFVLRPHFRVRGDFHLAIGSIVGLGWMLSGAAAVVFRVLDEGYQAAFAESLAGSYNIAFWIVIALAGAAVWAWHWLIHFNNEGSVEGDRRRSPVWFFTVIVAGVLPGLIAMLVSVTTMISAVLIWFIGSTDQDAVDFFELAPAMLTAVALGFVTWAYHRWKLDRGGPPERNDALRFHDYVVLATGLVAAVGSTAVLISQLIEALASGPGIAGSLNITNTLITAGTVLAAAAAVWWWQWSLVEQYRAAEPIEESDSIWRKLYLVAAFGVGGLTLSGSAIWVLFVILREVLDSQTNHDTLGDLVSPVGWGVAVLGAVWYHLGVWQVDRGVLAQADAARSLLEPRDTQPQAPLPPGQPPLGPSAGPALSHAPQPERTAPSSAAITLRRATADDAGELFTLRRAAGAEAALRAGTLDVRQLQETLADVQTILAAGTTTVAVDRTRIVGAVTRSADGTPKSGVIAPDRHGDGIDSLLLNSFAETPTS
jgi:hypothetical protein